jgi:tRNA U34 5-carboxymethylaminomethyl modifying GTPase MnmE/TrmE
MNECILVGQPNAGKTLFALHFVEFLGMRSLDVTFLASDGLLGCKHYKVDQAIRELSGMERHKTKELQTMALQIPVGKSIRQIKLIDSCGLSDGIHPDAVIRRAMAQTLSVMRYAKLILHIIDVSLYIKFKNISEIDQQIAQYGRVKGGYAVIANKIDLPNAKEGLSFLADIFPGQTIFPISALHKKGFKEVKALVCRYL